MVIAVGGGREEQGVLAEGGVVGQVVFFYQRHEMRRDRDVADTSIALGRADDEPSVDADHPTTDPDPVGPQVDVAAAELSQLSEAHCASCGFARVGDRRRARTTASSGRAEGRECP